MVELISTNSWITTSLLMFTFSVSLYSIIRYVKKYSLSSQIINVFIIGIPGILFLLKYLSEKTSLEVNPLLLMFGLFVGICINYIAVQASIKGINLAPNAGYSLIIQKGYASFTLFASVILFGSILDIWDIAAAIIVFLGMYLVLVQKSKNSSGKNDSSWIIYTILTYLLFGVQTIITKFVINSGESVDLFMGTVMTTSSILGLGVALKRSKLNQKLSVAPIVLLMLAGFSSFLFNYFKVQTTALAPNIGYGDVVNASSIIALTLVYRFVFKDELDKQGIFGIAITIVGLCILFLA